MIHEDYRGGSEYLDRLKRMCTADLEDLFRDLSRRVPISFDSYLKRIERENQFYTCFPFLFSADFPTVSDDDIRKIALSGNLYFRYLIDLDEAVDSGRTGHLLSGHVLHEAALDLLRALFDGGSPFWTQFERYRSEFINAVMTERRRHFETPESYDIDEMETIAAGKAAYSKSATAALSIMGKQDQITGILSRSQDHFHIGAQLYDDLLDWKDDYREHRYSYLLTRVIHEHYKAGAIVGKDGPPVEEIGRAMYFSGIANETLELAGCYFGRALADVDNLKCDQWKYAVRSRELECEQLATDISKLVQREFRIARPMVSVAAGIVPDRPAILESIRRAVNFILSAQTSDGNWSDFSIAVGSGTEWVTGYVGCALSSVRAELLEIPVDTGRLLKACTWLREHKHRNGGWGFNRESGVDADSTANAFIFLKNEEQLTDSDGEDIVRILLACQCEDGGIGTYSDESIALEIDSHNPFFDKISRGGYRGWRSSDTQVTANVLRALKRSGHQESCRTEKAIRFIIDKQHQEGYWNSYWSNGKSLGTSSCIEALEGVAGAEEFVRKAAGWLIGRQGKDGGWTDGSGPVETPFDTALSVTAVLAAAQPSHDKAADSGTRGIVWLLRNQLDDGSWESFPVMKAPMQWDETQLDNPQSGLAVADLNRLFTTATVLRSLTKYFRFAIENRSAASS